MNNADSCSQLLIVCKIFLPHLGFCHEESSGAVFPLAWRRWGAEREDRPGSGIAGCALLSAHWGKAGALHCVLSCVFPGRQLVSGPNVSTRALVKTHHLKRCSLPGLRYRVWKVSGPCRVLPTAVAHPGGLSFGVSLFTDAM